MTTRKFMFTLKVKQNTESKGTCIVSKMPNIVSKSLLVILALFLVCAPLSAQQQTKIDRNQLELDRQKKAKAEKAAQQRRQAAARQKTTSQNNSDASETVVVTKPSVTRAPKAATFLLVNDKADMLNHTTSYASTIETFRINTNGDTWTVSQLPSWCQVYTRTANSLKLVVNENPNYEERTAYIRISSGNQYVNLVLTQQKHPVYATATINRMSLDHVRLAGRQTKYSGRYSMELTGSCSVSGDAGLHFLAVVTAHYENGYAAEVAPSLGGVFSDYTRRDGTFFIATPVTEEQWSTSSATFSFHVSIPNDAISLGLRKERTMYLSVSIYCVESGTAVSDSVYSPWFKAKQTKHGLETKAF